MNTAEYLLALPKTELHCHFTSTMDAARLIALADRERIELPSHDPEQLFAYDNLADFLVAFQMANRAMTRRDDFSQVAYDGVRAGLPLGLRYREYYVNPQYFAPNGLGYADVIEPIIDGLTAARTDFGVDFRIVVAINRRAGARAAVELAETVVARPYDAVVGFGQDDLTEELTEDPGRFSDAYDIARRGGLKLTAHVGERPVDPVENIRIALDALKVDRIDHGYQIVHSPDLVTRARDSQVPFACTPISTTICSGYKITPQHPVAAMVRAGLNVSFSTDDAVFFRTDIAREYTEALPALGLGVDDADRIVLAGIDGAFLDDDAKASLRATCEAEIATLRASLTA
jgi:adenosine deaminase